MEAAGVDPLHDADHSADRARDQRRHADLPLLDAEEEYGADRDRERDRGHAGEVDDLGLAVGGLLVVAPGLVDRVLFPFERVLGFGFILGRTRLVDEAEQVGRRGGDEMEADSLPDAGQHRACPHGQFVTAVQLGRDLRVAPGRPVCFAVEAERAPAEQRPSAFRQHDRALQM